MKASSYVFETGARLDCGAMSIPLHQASRHSQLGCAQISGVTFDAMGGAKLHAGGRAYIDEPVINTVKIENFLISTSHPGDQGVLVRSGREMPHSASPTFYMCISCSETWGSGSLTRGR